jgi:hypothetical protein
LVKVTILDCIKASLIFFKDSSMTDKLTTAEVRLAATTNLDLPLTQYKKLESGFDAWLESVKAEARAAERIEIWAAMKSGKAPDTAAQRLPRPRTEIAKPTEVAKPEARPVVNVTADEVSSDLPKADDENAAPKVRDPKRKRIRSRKKKQAPAAESPTT